MVAYSFSKQFAAPILLGTKRRTIRANRKRHARPAEQVQLYTGMRTKQCRPIGVATCETVISVQLDFRLQMVRTFSGATVTQLHAPDPLDAFARADGFPDWEHMRAFWRVAHGEVPFTGALIRWTDFKPAAAFHG